MTDSSPPAVDIIRDVLASLERERPAFPDACSVEHMNPWRDRIDAIDRAIITLLNERAVCALEIGRIKKQLGIPVYVPSREEDVLENVMETNPGPLADQATRRLYERIIDETRSLERGTYQNESDESPPQNTD